MRSTESLLSRARGALAAAALLSAACASVGPSNAIGSAMACSATNASGATSASGASGASPMGRLQTALPLPTASRASYVITTEKQPGSRQLSEIVRMTWPALVYGDLPRGNAGQGSSMDRFGVYDVRGVFLGGPDYLQGVRALDVLENRRLTPVEEFAVLGRRHPAGAVLLTWNLGGR